MIGSIKFEKSMKSKKSRNWLLLKKGFLVTRFYDRSGYKALSAFFEEFGLKQLSIITHLENQASQK